MRTLFNIQIEQDDRVIVFAVRGDLDLSTAGFLDDALTRADASAETAIIVDLADVDFIDSSGLRVLVKHAGADGNGRRFRLRNCSAQARRLFEVSGISDRLPLVRAD